VDARSLLETRRWLVLASAVVSFFAVGVTFFAVPPLIPELVTRFGLSHLRVGLLMGAIAAPAIVLSIPLGAAVDRWPARAAGNFGLATMAVGAVLFATSPRYELLLLGRLLFGVGGLVMNLLLARLISTAFTGRRLALAMGIFMAVYPASMIVMFSAHPALRATLGWRGELAALTALVLLALPLHNLAVPTHERGGGAPLGAGRLNIGRPLAALTVSWMMFFAAFASALTFAAEWAGGGRLALLTVTLVMWVSLLLSPVVGLLLDRTGRAWVWVAAGQLLLAAALGAMAAGALRPLAAMLLVGVGAAVVPTATYTLPARLVPASRVGLAFGLITAFSNLGTVVGPAAAGALRDAAASWSLPWSVLATAALLGAGAALFARPTSRPTELV
jgi:predicted MFS family arabinose efflux permease